MRKRASISGLYIAEMYRNTKRFACRQHNGNSCDFIEKRKQKHATRRESRAPSQIWAIAQLINVIDVASSGNTLDDISVQTVHVEQYDLTNYFDCVVNTFQVKEIMNSILQLAFQLVSTRMTWHWMNSD